MVQGPVQVWEPPRGQCHSHTPESSELHDFTADCAKTPYGLGIVEEMRPSKGTAVVQFPWGTGFLGRRCVERSRAAVLESRLRTLGSVFAVLVQPCTHLLDPEVEVFGGVRVSYAAEDKSWSRSAEALLLWLKQALGTPKFEDRRPLQEVDELLSEMIDIRIQLGTHYSGGVGCDAELVAEAVRDHLTAIDACELAAQRAASRRREVTSRDPRVLELEQSQEFGKLRTLLEALVAEKKPSKKGAGSKGKRLSRSIDDRSASPHEKQLATPSLLPATLRMAPSQPAAPSTPSRPSWSSRAVSCRVEDVASTGGQTSPQKCNLLPGALIWPGALPSDSKSIALSGRRQSTVAQVSCGTDDESSSCRTPCRHALSPPRTVSPQGAASVAGQSASRPSAAGSRGDELLSPPQRSRQCMNTGSIVPVIRCTSASPSPVQSPLRHSPLQSRGGCQTPSRPGTPARGLRTSVGPGSPTGTRIAMSPAAVAPMAAGPFGAVVAKVWPSMPSGAVPSNAPVIMAQPVSSR